MSKDANCTRRPSNKFNFSACFAPDLEVLGIKQVIH